MLILLPTFHEADGASGRLGKGKIIFTKTEEKKSPPLFPLFYEAFWLI